METGVAISLSKLSGAMTNTGSKKLFRYPLKPPYLILLYVISANVISAQPSVVFRSAVTGRIQNRLASEPNSELISSVAIYGANARQPLPIVLSTRFSIMMTAFSASACLPFGIFCMRCVRKMHKNRINAITIHALRMVSVIGRLGLPNR